MLKQEEKFQKARDLIKGGMTTPEALKKTKLSVYLYYKMSKKPKRQKTVPTPLTMHITNDNDQLLKMISDSLTLSNALIARLK